MDNRHPHAVKRLVRAKAGHSDRREASIPYFGRCATWFRTPWNPCRRAKTTEAPALFFGTSHVFSLVFGNAAHALSVHGAEFPVRTDPVMAKVRYRCRKTAVTCHMRLRIGTHPPTFDVVGEGWDTW